MCARRDEGSDRSLSIGSVDDSRSEQESFPEVVDSDQEVLTESRSSGGEDEELTLTRSSAPNSHASTPSSATSLPPSTASIQPSTAPAEASYSDHHHHQQKQQQQRKKEHKQEHKARRTSRASSNSRVAAAERNIRSISQRSQLPLHEVVERRAFECTIGARGELSRVVDLVNDGKFGASDEVDEPVTESEDGSDKTPRHHRRYSHGRSPSSEFRVEPVPYGADIYVDQKDTSKCFWGVDLHWCDLESFFGLPAELGTSPWDSDEEDEDDPWQCICVYLDASLNRLRGIDAISDQPSLRELAYLDISYNLVDDLDTVQDLHHLQVLTAANNQIDSIQALGELPKGSGLRHVDLSSNSISVVEAPQLPHAFRRLKTLNLASNHLQYFVEEAALTLTSLERLDVSDNELVSMDWVALLEALRFLDCSGNRVSVLATFVRALADPPRLAEVIAEDNPVAEDPQYRITILTKCKNIKRLDHRPVDAAALRRQLRCAIEAKVLATVREAASNEYHSRVEVERSRLERRKSVLKAQERQLDDAFQGYRAQKQREMRECVAYAESLRAKDGQFLTLKVGHVFQEAVVRDRRPRERGKEWAARDGSGSAESPSKVERSLKTVLRAAVVEEHPEERSGGSSSYDSNLSTRDDDAGSLGSEFSHFSSDVEAGGTGSSISTSSRISTNRRTSSSGKRSRRLRKTKRSQSTCSLSAPVNTSGRAESREERGRGSESERRGVVRDERGQEKRPQAKGNRAASASKKKEAGPNERSDRSSALAVDATTRKVGGGGIVHSVLGAIGWLKAAGSNSNSNSNASLATVGSASQKAKS
eukprot:g12302.t1